MKRLEEAKEIADREMAKILEERCCSRCFAFANRRRRAAFIVHPIPTPDDPSPWPFPFLTYCAACLCAAYPARSLAAGLLHGFVEAIHETPKDDLH